MFVASVCCSGGHGTGWGLLGDTWEWNGFSWVARSLAGAPSPRSRVSMTFDEVRRETLLFGGGDGSIVHNELWAWNGVAWTQKVAATAPPARWDAALAFDGNCGRAVLVGGGDVTWANNFADGWAWDGSQWTQLGGGRPPARHSPALAHDAQRGKFVLFGGRDSAGFRSDTWELGASCSRAMATIAPAVLGQTAQFRYSYPANAANQHLCLTLFTLPYLYSFTLSIYGLPSIGRCLVDVNSILLDPALILDASGSLVTSLPIPNNSSFAGFQFDVQALDLDLSTNVLRWSETDVEVTVAPFAAPIASFTSSNRIGSGPLTVNFADTSTQFPAQWEWDFNNDGVTDSYQQNPSWTYSSNGIYAVRLVAANFIGSGSVVRSGYVWVGQHASPSLQMVPIAPGTFQRGQVGVEEPVHQVTLTNPFWMSKYEVTQSQYQSVVGYNPSLFQGANVPNSAQRPVEQVSWYHARSYCAALTFAEVQAGRVPFEYEYRLPTEAEWEYCCRAGTTSEWSTGTALLPAQANFQGSLASPTFPNGQTAPVGSYSPNAFGLHDMHGNVVEWCLDASGPYSSGPSINPFRSGSYFRIVRGGEYYMAAGSCMSAYRASRSTHPNYAQGTAGIRLVLAPIVVP